jgi:hypothetical protein
MSNSVVPTPPASREPVPGRNWDSPGLLRRVEAHRGLAGRDLRHRDSLWSRLHRRRWSAEGAVMIVVSAVCVGLTALAVSAARGGPGVISSGAPGCIVSAGRGAPVPCLSRRP